MYNVKRNGVVVWHGTHDECFIYILKAQGQSVSYATTYGGFAIVEAK